MSKPKPTYTVKLTVNREEHVATGATLEEAILNIDLTPLQLKTKGEFVVTKGGRTATRLIQLPKLRRMFMSKMIMSGFIRDVERLLA